MLSVAYAAYLASTLMQLNVLCGALLELTCVINIQGLVLSYETGDFYPLSTIINLF